MTYYLTEYLELSMFIAYALSFRLKCLTISTQVVYYRGCLRTTLLSTMSNNPI
jgi:hypothetical protein